ncbi:MAG: hypothetical protein EB060_12890 [Proteobacteria bacterium]|nr:hypothetical protein [Pseudomonadota bacterium]
MQGSAIHQLSNWAVGTKFLKLDAKAPAETNIAKILRAASWIDHEQRRAMMAALGGRKKPVCPK